MANEKSVVASYEHSELIDSIEKALTKLGKTPDDLTVDHLYPVDEFHIGGNIATKHLMTQLDISENDHLLDIGCGLGGAARYIATHYKCKLSGIDLTADYIEAGNILSTWVGLEQKVILNHGSALKMPYKNNNFDGCYMLHVGMNIDDKNALFKELNRVIKPGKSIAIYDIMLSKVGKIKYPVPWANEQATSHLSTQEQYIDALKEAGFEIKQCNDRREFAQQFFNQILAKTNNLKNFGPLGLHILMQQSTAEKYGNMIQNTSNGLIAPIEIIAKKIDSPIPITK